jgi:hypothetical protein
LTRYAKVLDLFVTKPHFLAVDSAIADGVSGLAPSRELHDSVLYVEPFTGGVMYGGIKLQFNVAIHSLPSCNWLLSVKSGLLPYYWMDSSGEISDEDANYFKQNIQSYRQASDFTVQFGFAMGATLLFLAVVVALCSLRAHKKRKYFEFGREKDERGNDALAVQKWKQKLHRESERRIAAIHQLPHPSKPVIVSDYTPASAATPHSPVSADRIPAYAFDDAVGSPPVALSASSSSSSVHMDRADSMERKSLPSSHSHESKRNGGERTNFARTSAAAATSYSSFASPPQTPPRVGSAIRTATVEPHGAHHHDPMRFIWHDH